MSTVAGRSRPILNEAEIVVRYDPEAGEIKFAEVVDPKSSGACIKKRERDYGVKLDEDTIESEEGKLKNLEKTIPRLHRELKQAYMKQEEFTSKKPHWAFAREQRGQIKFAGQMDVSLKSPKAAKKQKISKAEKAKAAAFIAGEEPEVPGEMSEEESSAYSGSD